MTARSRPHRTTHKPVDAWRDASGLLNVQPSFEDFDQFTNGQPVAKLGNDGDDYIEGGEGDDRAFGGLGQDDIIGGNSNLYGFSTVSQRQDGSDLIFGGAGTRIARNDLGMANYNFTDQPNAHSRDADMILADNGNLFRLVGVTVGTGVQMAPVSGAGTIALAGGVIQTFNGYLSFAYDNYSVPNGTALIRIVARAAQSLDYTWGGPSFNPSGAAKDIGAADEIHGGASDDFIYGQKGDDVLFGDGQDDDIIGGYGNDWISGGTGSDGIIGDDGRIFSSRNGTAELLYNIPAVPAGQDLGSIYQLTGQGAAGHHQCQRRLEEERRPDTLQSRSNRSQCPQPGPALPAW